MTARNTWKAYERRIADDFGGRRIPVTGIDRDGADVETKLFLIQAKLRKVLPWYLWSWVFPIAAIAAEKGKIGIVVLRKKHMLNSDSLVVMKYSDFLSLHGIAEPEQELES